jgi:alkanesulfonate monooxygenase SsuD/methylene tetrahydromethanopterin reductase-like flavin-dependent oxidoreductase (luciferase family)
VITAPTQEEVDAKLAQYKEHRSTEGMLVHQSVPIRALDHPRERTIAEALEIEGLPADTPVGRKGAHETIGDLLDAVDEAWQDRFFVAGTPEVVADRIEHWLDVDGIDGINLRQYHSFDTVRDFAELVSPILRERGRLPERGTTLRAALTGTDRLPAEHPAAAHRGAFHDHGV